MGSDPWSDLIVHSNCIDSISSVKCPAYWRDNRQSPTGLFYYLKFILKLLYNIEINLDQPAMVFKCDWFYYIHPNELNISRMILDISRHNLAEPDFSISSQEVLWGRLWDLPIDSKPTDLMRLSWNSAGWYRLSVRRLARSQIFRFPQKGAVGARLSKFSNRFTAYSIYPIELKLSKIIPSYQSAQSVWAGYFRCRGEGQNFKIFCGRHLCMFPCLASWNRCFFHLRYDCTSVRR